MKINGGRLDIGRNYYIVGSDSQYTPGVEVYTTSNGHIWMVNASDEVHIGGDFITKSSYGSETRYTCNLLTAGTMYVGGSFRQLGADTTYKYSSYGIYDSFNAQSGHKTVLTGTGTIEIEFKGSKSGFGQLEVGAEKVIWKGYANWYSLLNDIDNVVSSGMQLSSRGTTSLAGHSITITGNVTMIGGIDLDAGVFKIKGSLSQQSGQMNINGGKLDISGGYYILGPGSQLEAGVEVYNSSDGTLRMTYASDEVRVGGDFITNSSSGGYSYNAFTAGTLYVGGNFRQLGTNEQTYNSGVVNSAASFNGQNNHKTVLTGTGIIEVTFLGSASHFGTLEITQAIDMYKFSPDQCWLTLIKTEAPLFGTPDFILPSSLVEVDESAFERISATIVYVPDSCTKIGANAFRDSKIAQIRIPENCSIEDTAFNGCEAVMIFGIPGSAAEDYCDSHDNCIFVGAQ